MALSCFKIERLAEMKKLDIKLNRGDWVVHAQHGLGQVESLSIKNVGGRNALCLEVKTGTLAYFLPIKDIAAHHVRHISTPAQMKSALKTIASSPEPIGADYRMRNSHIHAEIARGTLAACAGLIRDLTGSKRALRKNDINENAALGRLKLQLVDEMMLVCKLTHLAAQRKLDQALKKIIPLVNS